MYCNVLSPGQRASDLLGSVCTVQCRKNKLINLIVGGISPHTEDAESCGFFIRQNLAGKLFITVKQM